MRLVCSLRVKVEREVKDNECDVGVEFMLRLKMR